MASKTPPKNNVKTEIIVNYDCGYQNAIFIRGSGTKGRGSGSDLEELSWSRGIPLKNISENKWVFECETPKGTCEYKILLNDEIYEYGGNHILLPSENNFVTPHF